jgi:hypothetical protein
LLGAWHTNGASDETEQESGEAKVTASEAIEAVVPVEVLIWEGIDWDSIKKMFDARNKKKRKEETWKEAEWHYYLRVSVSRWFQKLFHQLKDVRSA